MRWGLHSFDPFPVTHTVCLAVRGHCCKMGLEDTTVTGARSETTTTASTRRPCTTETRTRAVPRPQKPVPVRLWGLRGLQY